MLVIFPKFDQMKTVTCTIDQQIALVTLNRPEKRNALGPELVQDLTTCFTDLESDSNVSLIILTGNGPAFCAGADLEYLRQLQTNTFEENLADSESLKQLFYLIYSSSKVVITAIQGHALAGGCGLAFLGDFIFAAPDVKFGFTEVKIGFIPALVSQFLRLRAGETITRELLLGGELITAPRALQLGLITQIIPHENLLTTTQEFALNLLRTNSATAMGLTRKLLAETAGMSLEAGLKAAAIANARARQTDDCRKGIDAFLNKKPLLWQKDESGS